MRNAKAAALLQACALPLLALIAYWPSLHGGFIWDDVTFISDNDLVRSPNGLFNIWFTRDATDYWPLAYTVFWFLWRAFGADTLGYHLLNVGVHALNAILLWRILARMGFRWGYLAALLFVVHPVAVEAVAWIFQLKTSLAACFTLASFYFWVRFYDGNRRRTFELSLLFFAFALLTKTSVVTWPLVMLGYVLWKQGKLQVSDWLRLSPFALLSLIAGTVGLYWYEYDQLLGTERVRVESLMERTLSAGYAFWFYIWKGLIPLNLTFIYPRWEIHASLASVLPLLAVLIAAVFLWRRSRSVFYALAFFAITIFPVLGFFDIYYMRFSYVADHWQYVSLIATVAVIAALVSKVRWLGYVLVAGLTVLTFKQASLYADEETIWRDTLAKNPRAWLAENGLGLIQLRSGRRDEAVAHFKHLIADKPEYVDPYLNLGVYYLGQGDDAEASLYFSRALKVFPHNARASNNMAALALRHGEPGAALYYLEDAVAYLPTYAMGFKNLGIVYAQLGREEDAVHAFERALQLRSDDLEAQKALQELRAK